MLAIPRLEPSTEYNISFTLVYGQIPLVVQPQLPTEHDDQDIDALGTLPLTVMPVVPVFFPTPAADPPTLADPAPAPAAVLLPQPGNNWLGATNLVARDDGRLLQTGQSREINRYISKAVRLMNLKIFFVDAFPDLETQNNWLSECLVTALKDQAQTDNVAREVNLRAQQDHQYMSGLISMVRYLPPTILSVQYLSQIRWQTGGAALARW